MTDKALLIIPTYNELDNVKKLIPDILGRYDNMDILFVDDNSPDGTGEYVKSMQLSQPRLKLLERPKKMGLGTAYVDGFNYCLKEGYKYAVQMDADYSHDPKVIKTFLEEIKEYDLVLGSRYCQGVNVVNWPMRRLLLSYFASYYTRVITGLPIHDATGGFKCWRREVLEAINLNNIKSNGYSFQIETTFKTWKKGFKIKEVPIIFIDRMMGQSKMSNKIVREAVVRVWKLRIRSMFNKL
jgi:dolichol-phosphate mannosyltransferase